jgi:hypothetical protein
MQMWHVRSLTCTPRDATGSRVNRLATHSMSACMHVWTHVDRMEVGVGDVDTAHALQEPSAMPLSCDRLTDSSLQSHNMEADRAWHVTHAWASWSLREHTISLGDQHEASVCWPGSEAEGPHCQTTIDRSRMLNTRTRIPSPLSATVAAMMRYARVALALVGIAASAYGQTGSTTGRESLSVLSTFTQYSAPDAQSILSVLSTFTQYSAPDARYITLCRHRSCCSFSAVTLCWPCHASL